MTIIAGLSRCTASFPPKEELRSGKILGPDDGWELLGPVALSGFCGGEGANLVHRGKSFYDHVCASFGEWAFDAYDSSYIRTVVFLHYNIPRKLASKLGGVDESSGAKVFTLSGKQLHERYEQLCKQENNEVHVWRRRSQGEIAIDFCLGHGDVVANNAGRINLPTFAP